MNATRWKWNEMNFDRTNHRQYNFKRRETLAIDLHRFLCPCDVDFVLSSVCKFGNYRNANNSDRISWASFWLWTSFLPRVINRAIRTFSWIHWLNHARLIVMRCIRLRCENARSAFVCKAPHSKCMRISKKSTRKKRVNSIVSTSSKHRVLFVEKNHDIRHVVTKQMQHTNAFLLAWK